MTLAKETSISLQHISLSTYNYLFLYNAVLKSSAIALDCGHTQKRIRTNRMAKIIQIDCIYSSTHWFAQYLIWNCKCEYERWIDDSNGNTLETPLKKYPDDVFYLIMFPYHEKNTR